MREIKFRTWDKENHKMINPFLWIEGTSLLHNQTRSTNRFTAGEGLIGYKSPLDSLIVMQYTGLKDKNGKEIYEGDILSGIGFNKGVIVYDGGCFRLKNNAPLNYVPICWAVANAREVIGNVYENSELLEK